MNLNLLENVSDKHLIIAGEVGIDEYLWGDTYRISPEAPVPVVEVESLDNRLGLSANVAQNVISLGAKATLVSICGDDVDGERLQKMLVEGGISRSELIKDVSRPTPRKVRVMARRQHVVRVDYERSHQLEPQVAKEFRERLCDHIPAADGVIVQDYGKGLWNPDVMGFMKHATQHQVPVFVDPSRLSPLKLYCGATLLSPNLQEAEILSGLGPAVDRQRSETKERLHNIAHRILRGAQANHIVITLGQRGMVSVSQKQAELNPIPTFAREVFDVTGAGDTVIAVLALMTTLGASVSECMQVANAAAGIVVGHTGTASVQLPELKQELERLQSEGWIQ